MATKTNFRGSFTALVTPFKNGALDEAEDLHLAVGEGNLVGRWGREISLDHGVLRIWSGFCWGDAWPPRRTGVLNIPRAGRHWGTSVRRANAVGESNICS